VGVGELDGNAAALAATTMPGERHDPLTGFRKPSISTE